MSLVHAGHVVGTGSLVAEGPAGTPASPGAGGDTLLLETGGTDDLLLETGDWFLLE